jgi:hypothetical protein
VVQAEGRFLGLMTGGNQPGDKVDQQVDRAAMTPMLNLTDVFELIVDGLDDGSLTPQVQLEAVEPPASSIRRSNWSGSPPEQWW